MAYYSRMSKAERDIIITNDLDGVHFHAFPPMGTLLNLLIRGRITLPDAQTLPYSGSKSNNMVRNLLASADQLFHLYRPIKTNRVEVLDEMMAMAVHEGRNVGCVALTGREKHLQTATESVLKSNGYSRLFGNDLIMNTGFDPALWKQLSVAELVKYGFNVVHIEDDLKAALSVARVNDLFGDERRVLVYLLRNPSNHPLLLKRAGLILPKNVIHIHNGFSSIPGDFSAKLQQGEV